MWYRVRVQVVGKEVWKGQKHVDVGTDAASKQV